MIFSENYAVDGREEISFRIFMEMVEKPAGKGLRARQLPIALGVFMFKKKYLQCASVASEL